MDRDWMPTTQSIERVSGGSQEREFSMQRQDQQSVRLQMLWDNPSCIGTEVLARWGWSLGGFRLVLQSSLFDGVAFDPFSFQKVVWPLPK